MLIATSACLTFVPTNAFSIQRSNINIIHKSQVLRMGSSGGLVGSEGKEELSDENKAIFQVGCTVQVISETRAFQVPRKVMGCFQDGSFVPLDFDKDVPRRDMCLVLPKGMRAKVARVYDLDEFDASLPIVCKFEEGNGFGGECAPPATFTMHFDTHEVDVVE
jgi:hypothetical protein